MFILHDIEVVILYSTSSIKENR